MSHLILAGSPIAIDWPRVITWVESGWHAAAASCIHVKTPARAMDWREPARPGREDQGPPGCADDRSAVGDRRGHPRFSRRPRTSGLTGAALREVVQRQVRQIIVHHDGCQSSAMCFHVLHNERRLSCHLLVDNDGTIYQTIDLAVAAWHARGHNDLSVGIELCSRGNAGAEAGRRDAWGRVPVACTIHGAAIAAWGYTEAQYEAVIALGRALRRALPEVPTDYPRAADGSLHLGVLAAPRSFAGWLGHFHTTRRKWDPGPFDFARVCKAIGGATFYPVSPRRGSDPPAREATPVADDPDTRAVELERVHHEVEAARCGRFPTGPFCEYQLWHGGAHLMAPAGTAVHAALPGRLVAARTSATDAIGSTSFALVRHDLLGSRRFYTLYMHLDETSTAIPPRWREALTRQPDRVVLLDLPVSGGEVLGRVGRAGPDLREQVHFEVFSTASLDEDEATFELLDGGAASRFCEDPELLRRLGRPPFDERAVVQLYRDQAPRLRRLAVRSCSEWTDRCGGLDWLSALAAHPTQLSRRDLRELIAEQVDPAVWWTEETGAALGLPADGIVVHYHPITFLGWVTDELQASTVEARRRTPEVAQAGRPPAGMIEDGEQGAEVEAFHSREDLEDGEYARCRDDLSLDDALGGFERSSSCWPWE